MTLHLRNELGKVLVDLPPVDGDHDLARENAGEVIAELVDELKQGGPDRTALVGAIAAELQNAVGVCGDRRDGIARTVLDKALDRLQREAVG